MSHSTPAQESQTSSTRRSWCAPLRAGGVLVTESEELARIRPSDSAHAHSVCELPSWSDALADSLEDCRLVPQATRLCSQKTWVRMGQAGDIVRSSNTLRQPVSAFYRPVVNMVRAVELAPLWPPQRKLRLCSLFCSAPSLPPTYETTVMTPVPPLPPSIAFPNARNGSAAPSIISESSHLTLVEEPPTHQVGTTLAQDRPHQL